MSRIYEALLRAESEGHAFAPERNGRHQESAVAVLDAPGPRPGSDLPGGTGPASESAVAERISSQPYASAAGGLSFATHNWHPSLPVLPALLNYGPAVEQFRSLRSRLMEYRNQHPLKTLLVSSGVPKEGKSFISANLAISLARQKGTRVLLIDGDMRRCSLHLALGCEANPGLPDFLSGKVPLTDIVQQGELPGLDATKQRILRNLAFIPGGSRGEEVADLSSNPRFAELIAALAPAFDWIVVDSSPVLPVSDAVNLARACDGVLLVARGGVTEFEVAQRAQSEFQNSNVLGFVLNAAKVATGQSTYYEYSSPGEI
jgi:protein-tyrosine kinase